MPKKKPFRFVITYLCVAIPVLVVSLVTSNLVIQRLWQNEKDATGQLLQRFSNAMNEKYQYYTESTLNISSMTELLAQSMNGDMRSVEEGIKLLKNINQFDPFTYDVFTYYGGTYIYSAKGMTNLLGHFRGVLGCTPDSAQAVAAVMQSAQPCVLPVWKSGTDGYVLFHFPIEKGLDEELMSVNYCISFAQLSQLMAYLPDADSTFVNMTFSNGSTVCWSGTIKQGMHVISPEEIPSASVLRDYTSIQQPVASTGITVEVLYRFDSLYSGVRQEQLINVVLILCGTLISMMTSIVLGRSREIQIGRLESLFDSPAKAAPAPVHIGALGYIDAMIRRTLQENSEVEASVRRYRRTVLQQTAQFLFHGLVRDEASIERLLETCGMERCENYYYVGGILFGRGQPEERLHDFMEAMEGDLFCTAPVGDRMALLYFSEICNTDPSENIRKGMARRLYEILESMEIHNVHIGLSQVYQQITMVNYAYSEASGILEKMKESGAGMNWCECWEDVISTSKPGMQPDQERLSVFAQSVMDGESGNAESNLTELCQSINGLTASEENKAYLRSCILQTLITSMNRISLDRGNKFYTKLVNIDTSDGAQFEKTVRTVLRKYFSGATVQDDFSRMQDYIAEHYTESDLSAERVAAYAGFTKTYLSKLFHIKTGMSYIDYVTQLRMKKACTLLTGTNLPVSEIVRRVGYIDSSSFRRKFKTLYGVSAAAFRSSGGK